MSAAIVNFQNFQLNGLLFKNSTISGFSGNLPKNARSIFKISTNGRWIEWNFNSVRLKT